jgi:DNA-directed RNA polymerase subunit RPC12/RpoP
MRIRSQCRDCGLPFASRIEPGQALRCPGCGAERPVAASGWRAGEPGAVEACPLCGSRHLYRQRDFNRGLGCLLVLVGAALAPWTFGLSLVGFSLLDWWLWRRLPDAVVCYKCDTVYRDARPGPSQRDFDLLKHDVVKYGKSWEPNE